MSSTTICNHAEVENGNMASTLKHFVGFSDYMIIQNDIYIYIYDSIYDSSLIKNIYTKIILCHL